jgi:hypothetical protein
MSTTSKNRIYQADKQRPFQSKKIEIALQLTFIASNSIHIHMPIM